MEFKEARDRLPGSFFDTVCAFLNTDGGTIYLGIGDDGGIAGVVPRAVAKLKSDIANLSNNAVTRCCRPFVFVLGPGKIK